MAIQQMLLGGGSPNLFGKFTLDSTSYDLQSGDCIVTTSGHYTLTAPTDGVNFKLFLWGAGGGAGANATASNGSAGGYAYGEFQLSAGDYSLLIGYRGTQADYNHTRSFPDGGVGSLYLGSGGGSTRFGPTVADSAASYNATSFTYYLIAGGGGGGANWATYNSTPTGSERGEGGGTDGGDGGYYYEPGEASTSPGKGGSQSAGGAGGTGGRQSDGNAGAKYSGADGGSLRGGGGGGGYYGGGSGAGYYAQGGGGSGYINTGVVSNGVLARGGTGSSLAYTSAYNGPNSEQPSNAGDGGVASNGISGGAVFRVLPL